MLFGVRFVGWEADGKFPADNKLLIRRDVAVCSAEETSSDEEDGDGPAAQAVIVGNAPGGLPSRGADGAAERGEQV